MFLEGFQIAEAAELIDECVLIEFLSFSFPNKTGSGNIFDINLSSLPRILHLFIRFRLLFWIGQLDRLATDATQDTVKTGDGSGVSALTQLNPEHHQTGVRIPAAHIFDELNLVLGMLVGMAVRAVRAVCQGLERAVVLLAPPIDVLSAGLVADGSICDAIFERILNYHLLKPHVLCYLTHSE